MFETREISDSDLDNVSGGLVGELVATATGIADSVAPVSSTLATVQGVAQMAGVDPTPVTSVVTSL